MGSASLFARPSQHLPALASSPSPFTAAAPAARAPACRLEPPLPASVSVPAPGKGAASCAWRHRDNLETKNAVATSQPSRTAATKDLPGGKLPPCSRLGVSMSMGAGVQTRCSTGVAKCADPLLDTVTTQNWALERQEPPFGNPRVPLSMGSALAGAQQGVPIASSRPPNRPTVCDQQPPLSRGCGAGPAWHAWACQAVVRLCRPPLRR